jgi:hypothetical protein
LKRWFRWLFPAKPERYICPSCEGVFYSSVPLKVTEYPCLCERRWISS